MKRRTFISSSAGVGTVLLAGCTGDGGDGRDGGNAFDGDGGASDGDGSGERTGTFRLLVSDQPNAIGDFDALNVSFSGARVFSRGEDEDSDDEDENEDGDGETADGEVEPTGNETEGDETDETITNSGTNETGSETDADGGNGTDVTNETDARNETDPTGATGEGATEGDETGDGEAETDEEGERGFVEFDLGGATVDLTEVVGDTAVPVLEGELAEGRYTKLELRASDVEGIVDGEPVEVKIPGERLRVVKPFEVEHGEELSFVFDIKVVERGRNGYNLLPVIGKTGVAGEDVEVEEVDPDERQGSEGEAENEYGEENGADPDGSGTPDDDRSAGAPGQGGNRSRPGNQSQVEG